MLLCGPTETLSTLTRCEGMSAMFCPPTPPRPKFREGCYPLGDGESCSERRGQRSFLAPQRPWLAGWRLCHRDFCQVSASVLKSCGCGGGRDAFQVRPNSSRRRRRRIRTAAGLCTVQGQPKPSSPSPTPGGFIKRASPLHASCHFHPLPPAEEGETSGGRKAKIRTSFSA